MSNENLKANAGDCSSCHNSAIWVRSRMVGFQKPLMNMHGWTAVIVQYTFMLLMLIIDCLRPGRLARR